MIKDHPGQNYQRKGQITNNVLWGSLSYNLPGGARIIALMDMCHSSTGLDLPYNYNYNMNTRRWTDDVNLGHSARNVVLLWGCDVWRGKMANGAITQAFVEAYETTGMATDHKFLKAVKKQMS